MDLFGMTGLAQSTISARKPSPSYVLSPIGAGGASSKRAGAAAISASWSEMKCARSTIRVTQRVDFRGPPRERPIALFMLPLFPARRAMRFGCRSRWTSHALFRSGRALAKIVCQMSALSHEIKAIINRRVRTIVRRTIAPACAALKHVNDTTDNAATARRASLVRWQTRLDPSPAACRSARTAPSASNSPVPKSIRCKGNQRPLIRYRPS